MPLFNDIIPIFLIIDNKDNFQVGDNQWLRVRNLDDNPHYWILMLYERLS